MWVNVKPLDSEYMRSNEISFELRMETILVLMIFAVFLCYLSGSERIMLTVCWPRDAKISVKL